MQALELMDGSLDVGRCGTGSDGYGGLKNYATAVALAAYIVYGYSGLSLAGRDNGFVDVASIHAFTAVFR